MKKLMFSSVLVALIVSFLSPVLAQEAWEEVFSFIVAADMRKYATEEYRTPQHFLGVCEAIQKVGKGALMVSPGDIDPPHAVREVISIVLGEDYPWYPVVGNHELEMPSAMEYLRKYNNGGKILPNVVRKGPVGCEETTYSFEWDNCHFVVLNQYYDGKSDNGTDGDIIPELLTWLEEDLSANTKKHIFVFGHEPIIAMPDMDNGRIRHQGDSLDKYPKNSFRFHQLLRKYGVTAFICGHTHNASACKINGLWQIDAGHARGIEGTVVPDRLSEELNKAVEEGQRHGLSERQAISEYYETQKKKIDEQLTSLALSGKDVIQVLYQFYSDYKKGDEYRDKYLQAFWENSGYARSTFLKIYIAREEVKVEFYRDDAQGGPYSLRHTVILD